MIDKPVTSVRVYYGSGKTATVTRDDDWSGLDPDDVQIVAIKYDDGTSRIMQGNDYYWRNGLDDYDQGDVAPAKDVVLKGAWMDDNAYEALVLTAFGWLG